MKIGGRGDCDVIPDDAEMVDRTGFERAEREQRARWALQAWDEGSPEIGPSASAYWVMPRRSE